MFTKISLKDLIERDLRFYEMALINHKSTQAASCKKQYGRSWKKRVTEEIKRLDQMLGVVEHE